MKKLTTGLIMATFLSLLFVAAPAGKARAQDVTVSYQDFYDELSPYGQWVNDPEYGNVWVPNEGGDFRPYGSRGRWAMTEYGNTWVSDDPWGWACYHYGRWTYNSYYGWLWVPGYEWAPAWVSWRYGGGYCGWAPMSPGYNVGASYGCPDSWWVFVGPQYMYRQDYYNYWRGPSYNRECLRQARVYDNIYTDNYTHVRYNYGPRASTIQQVTHQPVQVYHIAQTSRPGVSAIQQNTVNMYRPNVNRATANTARPASVIQAPHNIGRPEAAVMDKNNTRQQAFRQEVQRQNSGNTGVVGPRGTQQNNTRTTEPARTTQMQNNTRTEPARNVQEQNTRTEPARNNNTQRVNNQGRGNVEPQNNNQSQPPARNTQPNRPEPQRFTPEPQRNNVQPQTNTRPEPPRYNPPTQQQQPRPEPPRYNPPTQQQQQRPEPPRYNPAPAPAPRPQQQPAQERHEGGRR